MTSPDLIRELQASRPTAREALRARVRELTSPVPTVERRPASRLRLPRSAFVLAPVAAALVVGIGAAGVIGALGGSVGQRPGPVREPGRLQIGGEGATATEKAQSASPPVSSVHGSAATLGPVTQGTPIAPTPGRAQQVDATLTVKVPDSDHVSSAAQDALDLTRSLGGHVQSASVTTGDEAQATLTLRVPVDRAEDAVAKLSALGTIVSQQVSIQDLQEHLDALVLRARSVRAQIVKIGARLESQQLTPEQRAALELRRQSLRRELSSLRQEIRSTHGVASFATVQISVVTPRSLGVVPAQSRL